MVYFIEFPFSEEMFRRAREIATERREAFRTLRDTEYLAVDGEAMYEAYSAAVDILNTKDPYVMVERYVGWRQDIGKPDVADKEVMDFFKRFLRFC